MKIFFIIIFLGKRLGIHQAEKFLMFMSHFNNKEVFGFIYKMTHSNYLIFVLYGISNLKAKACKYQVSYVMNRVASYLISSSQSSLQRHRA